MATGGFSGTMLSFTWCVLVERDGHKTVAYGPFPNEAEAREWSPPPGCDVESIEVVALNEPVAWVPK